MTDFTIESQPHPARMEEVARVVVLAERYYSIHDPEKLAAARRVIERNTEYRAKLARSRLRSRCG